MWRGLLFFLKLAVVVALAIWLAETPGEVVVDWRGYRIETSVGILLVTALVIAVLSILGHRLWRNLRGAPGTLVAARRARRARRAEAAVTQGMVSVAAGELQAARRQARRAERLDRGSPLTRLLAAQTAQLDGDDAGARKSFEAMLEVPETRFLGLRGLYRLSRREGDLEEARQRLNQAHALHPDAPWVLSGLFEVALESGDIDGAIDAVGELQRAREIDKTDAVRRRAVLHVEKARRAHAAGEAEAARDAAKRAHELMPALVPAAAVRARVLIDADELRAAARAIETTWEHAPHPDLVPLYLEARKAATTQERVKRLEKLVQENPSHRESHLALGRAALEAEDLTRARQHLTSAAGAQPSESVCRLMAELEVRESGDPAAGRNWLLKAADAPDDPAWVCNACGAVAAEWRALCQHCGSFDTYAWRTPVRVVDERGTRATHARLEDADPAPAAGAPA